MNQQIRELAEQAEKYADDNFKGEPTYSDAYDSKFAELIVQECVNVALEQKKWVEDMAVHNSNDEAWNRARIQQSKHIVNKIKEHFGVEE